MGTIQRIWAFTITAALVAGCYNSGSIYDLEGDASIDTASPDTSTDMPYDVVPDTATDSVTDTWWPDTYTDTYIEPWPDTYTDTGYDTWWPDTYMDPYTDTWYDWYEVYDTWVDPIHDWTEPDLPPPALVGDGCWSDWECSGIPSSSAYCAYDIMGFLDFPGGYCSARCGTDWECGPSSRCVDVMFDTMCLQTCDYAEECRLAEGYDCMDLAFIGGGPYCLPAG